MYCITAILSQKFIYINICVSPRQGCWKSLFCIKWLRFDFLNDMQTDIHTYIHLLLYTIWRHFLIGKAFAKQTFCHTSARSLLTLAHTTHKHEHASEHIISHTCTHTLTWPIHTHFNATKWNGEWAVEWMSRREISQSCLLEMLNACSLESMNWNCVQRWRRPHDQKKNKIRKKSRLGNGRRRFVCVLGGAADQVFNYEWATVCV